MPQLDMGGQQGPQVLFMPLMLYMAAPSQPVGPELGESMQLLFRLSIRLHYHRHWGQSLVNAGSCCSCCQSGCTITAGGARAW